MPRVARRHPVLCFWGALRGAPHFWAPATGCSGDAIAAGGEVHAFALLEGGGSEEAEVWRIYVCNSHSNTNKVPSCLMFSFFAIRSCLE